MKIYEIVTEAGLIDAGKAAVQAFKAARAGAPAAGKAAQTATAGANAAGAVERTPSAAKEAAKDLMAQIKRSVYRQRFGKVTVDNHILRVAGTYLNVLQAFNLYDFVQEYWKNKLIIDADFKAGDLTDAQYRQFSRENLELLGVSIATSLGFGKLLRTVTNVPILKQTKDLGFGILGMFFGRNGGKALEVMASEVVALKVAKWLQTEEGQSAARSAVQFAVDPTVTFLAGLGPKAISDFVMGAAEEKDTKPTAQAADPTKQQDVGSVSQSGQRAGPAAPTTSNDPKNPASRNVDVDFDKIADKLNFMR